MWIWTRLAQRPERARQAKRGEHRDDVVGFGAVPGRVKATRVPVMAELKYRLHINDRADLFAVQAGPAEYVTFRPEGENIASGVPDVVPKLAGRHEEMHHPARRDESVAYRPFVGGTR